MCHAGLMAGVLAIPEQEPALAAKVVQRVIANLPKVMDASFAQDGAYPQGPGSWEYGTTFNVIAIDLLRGRFQQDFGLMEQPGFRATADYIVYSNCGDMKASCSPAQVWFARELSQEWRLPAGLDRATDKGLAKERLMVLTLTWANPGTGAKPTPQSPGLPRWWSQAGGAVPQCLEGSWGRRGQPVVQPRAHIRTASGGRCSDSTTTATTP